MPSAASVEKYWEFATVTEVGSCFGRHVRRPQVVDLADYIDMLEATLSTDDLLRLDLVVSGPLSVSLRRIKGFSPVSSTRLGSKALVIFGPPPGRLAGLF